MIENGLVGLMTELLKFSQHVAGYFDLKAVE